MLRIRSYTPNIIYFVILASVIIQFMATFVYMDFMHLFSALILPLIFIVIAGVFVRESIFFVIAPIILYFSDRVYIFLINGLYALDLIANDPTIGFAGSGFYVINLSRMMFAIGVSIYAVYVISAKSDSGWRLLHRLSLILLIAQGVEFLFWFSYFIVPSSQFLFAPSMAYFPIVMFTLTHPAWFTVDFTQSFADDESFLKPTSATVSSSGHPYMSYPSAQPTLTPSTQPTTSPRMAPNYTSNRAANKVICPHCQTENRATDNFCLKCGQRIKAISHGGKTAPPAHQAPAAKRQAPPKNIAYRIAPVCPECQTENINKSPFCINCGHNLKKSEGA